MPDVTMPQLGETVTEGTVTKWFKAVGDKIDADEVLFEVSTDKVDSEVPSPAAGYLAEILVPEGETVDVGTRLAVITEEAPSGGDPDETAPESGASGGRDDADEARPAAAEAEAELASEDSSEEPEPESEPAPKSQPRKKAESRKQPATGEADGDGQGGDGGGPGLVLSPVVRRLVKEHGIDATAIAGSGAGGRVTRGDVLAYIDRLKSSPAPAKTPAAPAAALSRQPAPAAATGDDEVIPFSNIRRRTGEHMVRSKATSPHVLTATEIDFHNVDLVRGAERARFKEEEGFSLTYLPFICRTVIDAIADFPHVNAEVGDNELIVHHRVHLGIAVDLSFEGLIVPVVQDAEGKRLRAIAREIADLAARARGRKLGADDIAGGTFTITNPGPFGTFITAPVINQPQVAILSTDGVRKRPVAVELPDGSDGIAVHPVGLLALTFDHRAFDGAYASAFLARCRDILETRDWSQEL